jgi:hypothetical protein
LNLRPLHFLQKSEFQGAMYEGSQKIRFPILLPPPSEMPLYSLLLLLIIIIIIIVVVVVVIVMWKNSEVISE